MPDTLVDKILKAHMVEGDPKPGERAAIKIDQTLTQDATGTMAYLQLEAMGAAEMKTELSVSYVDHNTLQNGFENADDHIYLKDIAEKLGIYYSRAGNGIWRGRSVRWVTCFRRKAIWRRRRRRLGRI